MFDRQKQENNGRAAFCMLVRNSADRLPDTIEAIEDLRLFFSESRVYIIENNSIDNTKAILTEYAAAYPGVTADSFDAEYSDGRNRIERMADLRNRYMSLIRQESGFVPDYLIVMDSDMIIRKMNLSRILRNAPADWAFLSADGRFYIQAPWLRIPALYYDLFAYVPAGSSRYKLSVFEMMENRFLIHKMLRRKKYVQCESAFGGLTIYRYPAVKDGLYSTEKNSLHPKEGFVCEHIPFNIRSATYGKGYVCRDMRTLYEPVSLKTVYQVYETHLVRLYMKREAKKILKKRAKDKEDA